MTDWNTATIKEFRSNGGKVGGHFEGATLLLLHHVGARTRHEACNTHDVSGGGRQLRRIRLQRPVPTAILPGITT